jgi:hypothetical protein
MLTDVAIAAIQQVSLVTCHECDRFLSSQCQCGRCAQYEEDLTKSMKRERLAHLEWCHRQDALWTPTQLAEARVRAYVFLKATPGLHESVVGEPLCCEFVGWRPTAEQRESLRSFVATGRFAAMFYLSDARGKVTRVTVLRPWSGLKLSDRAVRQCEDYTFPFERSYATPPSAAKPVPVIPKPAQANGAIVSKTPKEKLFVDLTNPPLPAGEPMVIDLTDSDSEEEPEPPKPTKAIMQVNVSVAVNAEEPVRNSPDRQYQAAVAEAPREAFIDQLMADAPVPAPLPEPVYNPANGDKLVFTHNPAGDHCEPVVTLVRGVPTEAFIDQLAAKAFEKPVKTKAQPAKRKRLTEGERLQIELHGIKFKKSKK